MNAKLQDDLASAVELECNVLTFVHDNHSAENDRRDTEQVAELRRLREQKRSVEEKHLRTRYGLQDQITELERKITEVDAGAKAEIAEIDRHIAQCKAYLAAGV
jgi:uncharacterized protein YlxW (UPF0749 family)